MEVSPLETEATQAALAAHWEKAISLNKVILKDEPQNLGAFNRLGRAYSEIGEIEKSKSSYREVLKHDPYNSIALKNLDRLKVANVGSVKITGSTTLSPDIFLESPGKTRVLGLTDLAKPETLAALHTGDQVRINTAGEQVRFEDAAGTKLGAFKGDLGVKLSEMLKAGSLYEAYVKSVRAEELKIFVREVRRAPKFAGTPSFPVEGNDFHPYVHEGSIETLAKENHEEIEGEAETSDEKPAPKIAPSVEALAEAEGDEKEPEED